MKKITPIILLLLLVVWAPRAYSANQPIFRDSEVTTKVGNPTGPAPTLAIKDITLTQDCPVKVLGKDQIIECRIAFTYTGAKKATIRLTDILPEQSTLVSAPSGIFDGARTVVWEFTGQVSGSSSTVVIQFQSLVEGKGTSLTNRVIPTIEPE